jgi:polyhydroxyalkanoate synthesis regulator phasin
MGWQDRFRALGDELVDGKITTGEYRERLGEILAEADEEKEEADRKRVHIPASAAWEEPSGEMTQIVGTRDDTTPVANPDTSDG